ncbi:ABC-type multidrug transport system, ATPase component [Pseudidiomarina planktonica]|uniref:ABC-type multidrug transport system, ATPase component n=1 Tax=Pseudidiomarina planktonica TaxID=1323738 RepID=A0A1Y6E9R9_9GAMM|nr:ABC transporter ATP-binding protein [Pseudidiomarina planktonica]RUO66261.1 ABC transporter ATP-binding protein [Pseudidiomarina planktonica]SMQ59296.1 ABC-type multidrug transport system, ATPase component [Pseudidiomarina planktonica]
MHIKSLKHKYKSGFSIEVSNLKIDDGCINAFVGKNGSGKSTFIKSLIGIIESDEYSIAPNFRAASVRRETSVLIEGSDCFYPTHTTRQNSKYLSSCRGVKATDNYIEYLADALSFKDKIDSRCSELSTGNKRLASIISLLSSRPKYLFLDEPTLGLDFEALGKLHSLLRELVDCGCTIILTSHDLSFVENVSDSFYFVANGSVSKKSTSFDISSLSDGVLENA